MHNTGSKVLFAGTIFSSAFLLFLVQPLIAKQILPWFGGSAAVWSICMVFFQVTLLAGYAYSDWISRHLAPRRQVMVHIVLLALSLAFLPILAQSHWKPGGEEDPTLWILGLLVATIGSALLSALDHRPPGPVLGLPDHDRGPCLPLLLPVQPGLPAGPGELPLPARTPGQAGDPGLRLVRGLCPVHPAVRGFGLVLLAPRSQPAPGGPRPHPPGRGRLGPDAARLSAVARPLGHGVLAPGGHHQPHHPERGGHPLPVAVAAEPLPVELRPVLRERPLVQPALVPAAHRGPPWSLRLRAPGQRHRRQHLRGHPALHAWGSSSSACSCTANWPRCDQGRAT